MAEGTTPEPSIEEILASIRKIISDDDPDADGHEAAAPLQAAPAPEEAWPESNDEEDVLELTEVVGEEPSSSAAPEVMEPPAIVDLPKQNITNIKLSEQSMPSEEGGIITDRTMAAATGAFAKLSQETEPPERTSGDGRTVEDITRELLRPMLRQWMDQNLPQIVERLVERELRKISRKAEDL